MVQIGNLYFAVKLRPYLTEFLEELSDLFDITVYTFGTRNYALEILKIVDPEEKYLSSKKLITRNESLKNYKEIDKVLHPDCLDLVVILDDTDHVWGKIRGNLIHVRSFNFFKEGGHGGMKTPKPIENQKKNLYGSNHKQLPEHPIVPKEEFYEKLSGKHKDMYLKFLKINLKMFHHFYFFHKSPTKIEVTKRDICL